MDFWISGRIDEQITDEMFRPVLVEIKNKIKATIEGVDFGESIASYDIMVNIFRGEKSEKFWYKGSTKQTDIDVAIDHDAFLVGNFNQRAQLFLKGILYSINELRKNKKLKGFDFDLFYLKIEALLLQYPT